MESSEKLELIIEQWTEKKCIDPHTELLARSLKFLVMETERTNTLLVEVINRLGRK